jgi:PAS domain S-box-containing protein
MPPGRSSNAIDAPPKPVGNICAYPAGTAAAAVGSGQALRKQAEAKLRESEAKYRAIVETTDTGFVILDRRGRVLDANSEYVRLTGHNELCEILGRFVEEWTAEHDKARNAKAVAQCMRDGRIRGLTIDYAGGDGRITPIEINATVQGDGKSQRIITLCRDITERKKTEETLRASENRLRAVIDAAPFGAHQYELRDNGRLVFIGFNASAERILGVKHDPFLGKTIEESFPGLDGTPIPEAYRKVAATGIPYATEQIYYDQDGISGAFDVRCVNLGARRMAAFFEDVTERKQAAGALRESEERFRTLFDSSPDPAWIIDKHRFVECNQAAVDMLGYPDRDSLKDTHPSKLSPEFQPDGELSYSKSERMMVIAHRKGFNRFEWVHRRWDQSDFFAEVTLSAISLQGRQVLYCIWRDITESKMAAAALTDEHNLYMDLVKSLPAGVYRLHIRRQKPWKKREWVGKVESNYSIEVMSNSFCRLLGASRQKIEANAATVVDCLHPDDRQDFVRRNVVALETMQPFEWEGRVNRPGPTKWVRFLSVPRSMPNGDVVWTGVLLDTTAVKRAVESLQKSRDELEDRVRERTARLRSLAAQLTRAEHAERRRIAHLLHEDLQQRLAAILYKVNDLKEAIHDAPALQTTDRTLNELAEAIELTRSLTTRLAPPVLYQLGFRPALETLAREMKAQFSLSIRITGLTTLRLPSDDMRDFAFDAVRELLLNVTKHAGVKSAEIRIRPSGKKSIAVEVRDKGKGIARKGEHTDRFGLFSIRERAEAMGIGFAISSRPGKGTCAALSFPLQQLRPQRSRNDLAVK